MQKNRDLLKIVNEKESMFKNCTLLLALFALSGMSKLEFRDMFIYGVKKASFCTLARR